MASKLALEKAAQVWCRPEVETKVMDVELAEAFAEVLDEAWAQPRLSKATMRELLGEIKFRLKMDGNLDYKGDFGDSAVEDNDDTQGHG